ncbi:MAG: hypothetical protein AAFO15_01760, partial [Pseudomonadota bacterium]
MQILIITTILSILCAAYVYKLELISLFLMYKFACNINISEITINYQSSYIPMIKINNNLQLQDINISYSNLFKAILLKSDIDIQIDKIRHKEFQINKLSAHLKAQKTLFLKTHETGDDAIQITFDNKLTTIQSNNINLNHYKNIINDKKFKKIDLHGNIQNFKAILDIHNQQLINIEGSLIDAKINFNKLLKSYKCPTIDRIQGKICYIDRDAFSINISSCMGIKTQDSCIIFKHNKILIDADIQPDINFIKKFIPLKIKNQLNKKFNFENISAIAKTNISCAINFFAKNRLLITSEIKDLNWSLLDNMINIQQDKKQNLTAKISLKNLKIMGNTNVNNTQSNILFKYYFKQLNGTLTARAPLSQELIQPITNNFITINGKLNDGLIDKNMLLFKMIFNKDQISSYIKTNTTHYSYQIPILNIIKKENTPGLMI